LESRDKNNLLHPLFTEKTDPGDYHIIKESTAAGDLVYEALTNGDPHKNVDLVFIAEGYADAAKGLYRPMVSCLMIYHPKNEFCLVCQQAIQRLIEYYSGPTSAKEP
jgi:hypothetical protein